VVNPGSLPVPGRGPLPWLLAGAGLAALVLASLLLGRYPVTPQTVLAVLAAQVLPAPLLPFEPWWPPAVATVVLEIRLPRVVAALLVGGALSGAGAAFQGVFRNPMVSPDILGVAAGAGLGAALAILFGLDGPAIQALAFVGGLAAVAVSYAIGCWRAGAADATLILVLAGIIVGTVCTAGLSLVKYLADPANTLPAITFWLMGSLAAVSGRDLTLAAPALGLGLAVLLLLRWRLNLLAFGDEEARALGVDVGRTRLAVIVAATLMTAAAVALSGVIGLVGLVVPHLARSVVGPNYRLLLPFCTVLGGAFLLLVDDAARSLAPGEIPLGILTSLIGAPFFLALLTHARKGWS